MRGASAALTSFLNSPGNLECVQIDLYTFALNTGEVFRWSGGNTELTIPSAGFPAGSINAGAQRTFILGPRFGRSKTTVKIGIEPAELDIDVLVGAGDLVGSLAFADAVRVGLFDGATVELDRFFAPFQVAGSGNLDVSLGVLLWFYGQVAECDIGRSKIMFKIKSLMNMLRVQQLPRRLYCSACSHIFGDEMCGYNRVTGENADHTAFGPGQNTFVAAAGSNQSQIVATTVPNAIYIQGTLVGATGLNAGYTRTISNIIGSTIFQFKPWIFPVVPGDTFNALPGCDHTTAECDGVFHNLPRFGGFPYIPPPEYAV